MLSVRHWNPPVPPGAGRCLPLQVSRSLPLLLCLLLPLVSPPVALAAESPDRGSLATAAEDVPTDSPAPHQKPQQVAGRTLEEWAADLSSPNRVIALRAVLTIGQFGEVATGTLTEALAHEQPGVRYWAASELGDIGSLPAAAVSRLTDLLDEEQIGVRLSAGYALCRSGQVEKSLSVLTDALSHPTRGVRNAAADFLARIGPPARAAIPALEQALKHQDYHTKGAAQEALLRIRAVPSPAGKAPAP